MTGTIESRDAIRHELDAILASGGPRGPQQSARVRALLRLGKGLQDEERYERDQQHMRLFDSALRFGKGFLPERERDLFSAFQAERRDMSDPSGAGAFPASTGSSEGGFFVPVGFEQHVWEMLKQTDKLFDEDIVTVLRSTTGAPTSIPALDDTSSAAQKTSQNQSQQIDEPSIIGQLSFETTPLWASGIWRMSKSLLADSGIPLINLFARTSATRFRRGIGKNNVNVLLGAATLGAMANGSADTDGIGSNNTIGFGDLQNLIQSIDPDYLASAKCRWVMNFLTYQSLLQIKDKSARPVIREQYNSTGERLLLGIPVALCPSMPSMSDTISSPMQTVTPIMLGDLGRFVIRVGGAMTIVRMPERFAELFQVGFESFLRADAGLMVTAGSDSPVKYMQSAA